MTYEYGEPLAQSATYPEDINRRDGRVFAHFSQKAKLNRVIACINACAGLTNEQLEKIGLGGVAKIVNRETHKEPIAGPPLTADEAFEWEWTGEQPRKLRTGEAGLSVPQGIGNCRYLIMSATGPLTEGDYWPLRRRQHTQSTEPTIPQAATLNDIADLLQRILDRMPERSIE